jgi:LemA protein
MIAGIVIAVIVAVVVIWAIATYNGLVGQRNQVEEAFSTMDVYLKKRFDLIPNLVESVKGYAAHEKSTLDAIVRARSAAASAGDLAERFASENELSCALRQLFALAESYPDLKANQNFLDLQSQLQRVEEDIANARKYYNGSVREFNNKVEMFPSSIIAGMFHFERKPMYEVANAAERENVQVSF